MLDEHEDDQCPTCQKQGGRRVYDPPPDFCQAHSGTVYRTNLIIWLLGILLLSGAYEMLVQIPSVRADVVSEVKGITARIVELEKADIMLKEQLRELKEMQDPLRSPGKKR